jgi:mitochondrial fission protein ELM1
MNMVVILKKKKSNIWIIHVQSPINLPKSMWKLVFNVANVIFWFGSPEKETHKV